MKPKKATLDEYRLRNMPFLGLQWRDKRNGQPEVYDRYFMSAWELRDFLEDYFGKRVALKVWRENVGLLP